MKTIMKKKTTSILAVVMAVLITVMLPFSAAGSAIDEAMSTYTVKEGDTLASIASAHGVTVSDIVTTNGISASAELYKGQKLSIPGASAVNEDSTTSYGTSSTISMTFKDADLLGVLETIISHTNYTLIFKGATSFTTVLPNTVASF